MTPTRPMHSARPALGLAALAAIVALAAPASRAEMRTFDGKDPIARIKLRTVYFVPLDRTPLARWRDRLGYFGRRIEDFRAPEFPGQSRLIEGVDAVIRAGRRSGGAGTPVACR